MFKSSTLKNKRISTNVTDEDDDKDIEPSAPTLTNKNIHGSAVADDTQSPAAASGTFVSNIHSPAILDNADGSSSTDNTNKLIPISSVISANDKHKYLTSDDLLKDASDEYKTITASVDADIASGMSRLDQSESSFHFKQNVKDIHAKMRERVDIVTANNAMKLDAMKHRLESLENKVKQDQLKQDEEKEIEMSQNEHSS